MPTKIRAIFKGDAKCARCGTAVHDGIIVAPWTWGAQVDAFRKQLASDRDLRTQDGGADIESVPLEDAMQAALTAHGGFIHTCHGQFEGKPCKTSFLVEVSDPSLMIVGAEL